MKDVQVTIRQFRHHPISHTTTVEAGITVMVNGKLVTHVDSEWTFHFRDKGNTNTHYENLIKGLFEK